MSPQGDAHNGSPGRGAGALAVAELLERPDQPAFCDPSRRDDGSGGLLVLIDASNEVERILVEAWVARSGAPGRRTLAVDTEGGTDQRGLARLAEHLEDAGTVVPVRVVWRPEGGTQRNAPRIRDLLLGDPRHPGHRRALRIARRHPERVRFMSGEPARLEDLHERHRHEVATIGYRTDFAGFVARQAGIALDVAERTIAGRRYKVPRFVTHGVEATPTFARAVDDLAGSTGRPRHDVLAEVRSHLANMVTEPNTFFIDWTGKLTSWVVSLAYREVVIDAGSVQRTRDAVRDHPSALLFTHKSHLDAIALLSVLYQQDFPAPHTMAGANIDFRGIRRSSRRSGIIFIRRSFGDAPAYKVALQQYLGFLMGKRFPFVWAFEGTRSRSGKLLAPRYGMLKYVLDAAHATDATDLQLMPVSINYDLIGEVGEYADQELGRPKQAESLSWLLDYLRRLRSPMGRMYLDFAEPVVVEGEVPSAEETDLPALAFEVARRANAQVPVTLPALMCLALLGTSPVALTYAQLEQRMRELLVWIQRRGIRLADGFRLDRDGLDRDGLDRDGLDGNSDMLDGNDDISQLTELADLTFERGLIHRYRDGPDTVFTITEDQHAQAGYYRNTIVHYFVDKAIAELALVMTDGVDTSERARALLDEARLLRDLSKFEFFHTPSGELPAALELELGLNPGSALSGDTRDTPERSQTGPVTWPVLDDLHPLVAHAVLEPYLEAYWVVAGVFARLGDGETIDRRECIGRSLAAGEQAFLQRHINSRASIGAQMFKGAYSLAEHMALVEPSPGVGERRRSLERSLRERTRAIGVIRRAALERLGIDP